MRRIILIGYMGSGKTTVGKALSKETRLVYREQNAQDGSADFR